MVGFMGDGVKGTANVLQSCIVNQSVSATFIEKKESYLRVYMVKCRNCVTISLDFLS